MMLLSKISPPTPNRAASPTRIGLANLRNGFSRTSKLQEPEADEKDNFATLFGDTGRTAMNSSVGGYGRPMITRSTIPKSSKSKSEERPFCEVQQLIEDTNPEELPGGNKQNSSSSKPYGNSIEALHRRLWMLTRRFEQLEGDTMGKVEMRFRMLDARAAALEETVAMELCLKAVEEKGSFASEPLLQKTQPPANSDAGFEALEKRLALQEAFRYDVLRGVPWNTSLAVLTDKLVEVATKLSNIEDALSNLSSILPDFQLKGVTKKMHDQTATEHSETYDMWRPRELEALAKEMRYPIPVSSSELVAGRDCKATHTENSFSFLSEEYNVDDLANV